jgi:exonuclease VII small subunit
VRWSRECHQFLEQAEQRIEIILKNEQGESVPQALELGENG